MELPTDDDNRCWQNFVENNEGLIDSWFAGVWFRGQAVEAPEAILEVLYAILMDI